MALASSFLDRPVPADTLIFGEVGLTGEIRAVSAPEIRLKEGHKLGFNRALLAQRQQEHLGDFPGLELVGVRNPGRGDSEHFSVNSREGQWLGVREMPQDFEKEKKLRRVHLTRLHFLIKLDNSW